MFFVEAIIGQSKGLRNFTVRDGLSSDVVYRCTQDREGFMWFATQNGVCRYDGFNYDIFTIEDGLTDNEVLNVKQDSKDRVWFLTLNGRLCFYLHGVIHNASNDPWLAKLNFNGPRCQDFYEDMQGRLWFICQAFTIWIVNNDSL